MFSLLTSRFAKSLFLRWLQGISSCSSVNCRFCFPVGSKLLAGLCTRGLLLPSCNCTAQKLSLALCIPLLVFPSESAVHKQCLQVLSTQRRAMLWHLLLAKGKAQVALNSGEETKCGILIHMYLILVHPILLHWEGGQNPVPLLVNQIERLAFCRQFSLCVI